MTPPSSSQLDPIPPSIRAAENEVDNAFKRNQLLSIPRPQAEWHFLTAIEQFVTEVLFNVDVQEPIQQLTGLSDEVNNWSKWPMRWLHANCPTGTSFARENRPQLHRAATELLSLGKRYLDYEVAFTYASNGLLTLCLADRRITPSGEIRRDTRWDAYDRIQDMSDRSHDFGQTEVIQAIISSVNPTVRVKDGRFTYDVSPIVFSEIYTQAKRFLDNTFRLPSECTLGGIYIRDYRSVTGTLWTLASIHFGARLAACSMGCDHFAHLDSLLIVEKDSLVSRVSQYSDVSLTVVAQIFDLLTFGGAGIKNPDVVLQPLVPLAETTYAIAPNLLINWRFTVSCGTRRPPG